MHSKNFQSLNVNHIPAPLLGRATLLLTHNIKAARQHRPTKVARRFMGCISFHSRSYGDRSAQLNALKKKPEITVTAL